MAVKAALKIVLMANDIEIAESNDPILWQNVFASITHGQNQVQPSQVVNQPPETGQLPHENQGHTTQNINSSASPLEKFASELGVKIEELEGALAPSNEAPYIHLDSHCWEALKKNTPPKGPQAIPPIALAGTVLAIWFKHAGIEGIPTTKQCHAVLKTIHIVEKNAARALKNTEWLQVRGNGIVINPAQRSRAVKLASSFCTKSTL